MYQLFKNLSTRQKTGFIILTLLAPIIIVVSIAMMHVGTGPIARIRNLDDYMTSATAEDKQLLQQRLYNFLNNSFNVDIGKLDIYIRDNSFIETELDGTFMADFIIDIDELRISYQVSYVFPNEKATSENPIFDCPLLNNVKYPETDCVGMYNSSRRLKLEADNPIVAILPISVDEYSNYYKQSFKYDIFGIYDEENDEFFVRIIDYSGYGYEHALETIRKKGFNPDDYIIDYISYGG